MVKTLPLLFLFLIIASSICFKPHLKKDNDEQEPQPDPQPKPTPDPKPDPKPESTPDPTPDPKQDPTPLPEETLEPLIRAFEKQNFSLDGYDSFFSKDYNKDITEKARKYIESNIRLIDDFNGEPKTSNKLAICFYTIPNEIKMLQTFMEGVLTYLSKESNSFDDYLDQLVTGKTSEKRIKDLLTSISNLEINALKYQSKKTNFVLEQLEGVMKMYEPCVTQFNNQIVSIKEKMTPGANYRSYLIYSEKKDMWSGCADKCLSCIIGRKLDCGKCLDKCIVSGKQKIPKGQQKKMDERKDLIEKMSELFAKVYDMDDIWRQKGEQIGVSNNQLTTSAAKLDTYIKEIGSEEKNLSEESLSNLKNIIEQFKEKVKKIRDSWKYVISKIQQSIFS